MKSKASYFSISLPLVRENLRRFWVIPVIGFLAYFLSGVFPILMSYSHLNDMYDYIGLCLRNIQPFFLIAHLFLPIITAVVVFRYLHSSGSVTALHSMPFTRAQLFNSNLLSGFLLTTLPLLLTELLLQLLAKPTYDYFMYDGYGNINNDNLSVLLDSAVNGFSRQDVLTWFWYSLIIVTFIYAVSVFAGMVTGNAFLHIALAFGFNFLLPALFATLITHFEMFLFGFSSSNAYETILSVLSPFIRIIFNNGTLGLASQVVYIGVSIALCLISLFLYQRRKMEKAGDSIVFGFMIPVICYLITFFGMSLMGFYFHSLGDNSTYNLQADAFFYVGLGAGAIISFILGRMIVLKTPRIFNKTTLKSFLIYVVAAAIFTVSVTFDLTGFEKRIPDISKIRSTYCTSFDVGYTSKNTWGRYDLGNFKGSSQRKADGFLHYTDPKNIEAMAELHKYIVEHKKDLTRKNTATRSTKDYIFTTEDSREFTLELGYDIGLPNSFQRTYFLPYKLLTNNKSLKQIYESSEFKSFYAFKNLNFKKLSKITLQNIYYMANDAAILNISDPNKINELLAAADRDFMDRTYEEYMAPIHPYCSISLDYTMKDRLGSIVESNLTFDVLSSDENTIAWLTENGYAPHLECPVDNIEKIIISEWDNYGDMMVAAKETAQTVKDIDSNQLVVTDPAQIKEIIDTFAASETNYQHYYSGSIVYKNTSGINETFSQIIFYDYGNAPKFIEEYFK